MMKKILIKVVKGYQRFISPLFPPSCRYYPTCSHYTVEAIEKHGAIKGGIMGLARILRCNPFVRGGVDRVPNHFTVRRNPDEKNGVYGYNVASLEEKKERKKQTEELYEKYKDHIDVYNEKPDVIEVIKELVDIEEKPLELLPQEYIGHLKQLMTTDSLESEAQKEPSFHFFEVSQNEKSEQFFSNIDLHTVMAHALSEGKHEERIGIVVEQEEGIWETNSLPLYKAFKRKYGVSKKDVTEKTVQLLDYLLLVQEDVDGISPEEWLEKKEE